MNSKFKDKFTQYLEEKMDKHKAMETVYGSQKLSQHSRNSGYGCNYQSQDTESVPSEGPSNKSFDSSLCLQNSAFKTSRCKESACKTASMSKRKLRKFRQIQQNVCSICLQPYQNRVQMSCKHSYCQVCLVQWLKTSSKCPYCRTDCSFYLKDGKEYQIEQRVYEYDPDEGPIDDGLDFQCYMCEETEEGDQVLICDGCEMYACHPRCDRRLRGVHLEEEDPWYCHFCS